MYTSYSLHRCRRNDVFIRQNVDNKSTTKKEIPSGNKVAADSTHRGEFESLPDGDLLNYQDWLLGRLSKILHEIAVVSNEVKLRLLHQDPTVATSSSKEETAKIDVSLIGNSRQFSTFRDPLFSRFKGHYL